MNTIFVNWERKVGHSRAKKKDNRGKRSWVWLSFKRGNDRLWSLSFSYKHNSHFEMLIAFKITHQMFSRSVSLKINIQICSYNYTAFGLFRNQISCFVLVKYLICSFCRKITELWNQLLLIEIIILVKGFVFWLQEK